MDAAASGETGETLAPWQLAERTVIVGVLQEASLLDAVSLAPERFSGEVHPVLWRSMQHLHTSGEPVDLVTLRLILGKHFAGRPDAQKRLESYLAALGRAVGGKPIKPDVLLSAARDVRAYAACRDIAHVAPLVASLAAANDVTVLEQTRHLAELAAADDAITGTPTWPTALDASYQGLADRANGVSPATLSVGLPSLDRLTLFLPGNLLILGKSIFALMTALSAARTGYPTLFVSLEMSAVSLADRAYCLMSSVSTEHFASGRLSDEEWASIFAAREQMQDWPLDLMDRGPRDLATIAARARRMKATTGIGQLIVDYIQRMPVITGRNQTYAQAIGGLSSSFKALAEELACPVLCLAQLNRQSDMLGKRPTLTSLKDSGNLEQDADVVLLLSPRLETFTFEQWRDQPFRKVLLDVAKDRRGGQTCDIPLIFNKSRVLFREEEWGGV